MSSKSVKKVVKQAKVEPTPLPVRSSRSRSSLRSGGPPAAEPRLMVEKILLKRMLGGELQYLVKWEGLEEKDSSWEAGHDLLHGSSHHSDLIQEYEKEQEDKKKKHEEMLMKVAEKNLKMLEAKKEAKRKLPWLGPDPARSPKRGTYWIPQGGEEEEEEDTDGDEGNGGGQGSGGSDGGGTPGKMKSLMSPSSTQKSHGSNSSTAGILTTPTKRPTPAVPQWCRFIMAMQKAGGNKQSWEELLHETDWPALEAKLRSNFDLEGNPDEELLNEELQGLAESVVDGCQALVEFGVKVSKMKKKE